ncbi:hypothetical protein THAOC_36675 [Thalassiosira oceanica]|uniref:Uncharacterized protein n=1 Tax=Thalassiosira oceanica TaxID=159749 RepID=K0R7T5_THAOC|nr:hypothetical protein THAOC_36675 [Thalassiosira oceanica]|eukprot:EJK44761.1 hypothetical protein THAOC_36675 [Thalassiosira oceanica]
MMVPKNGSTWLVEASRMVPVSLDYKVRVCMPTSVAKQRTHFSSSTVLLPTNGRRELTSARPGWIVDRTTWRHLTLSFSPLAQQTTSENERLSGCVGATRSEDGGRPRASRRVSEGANPVHDPKRRISTRAATTLGTARFGRNDIDNFQGRSHGSLDRKAQRLGRCSGKIPALGRALNPDASFGAVRFQTRSLRHVGEGAKFVLVTGEVAVPVEDLNDFLSIPDHTLVFHKAPAPNVRSKADAATTIQRSARGFLARAMGRRQQAAAITLQRHARGIAIRAQAGHHAAVPGIPSSRDQNLRELSSEHTRASHAGRGDDAVQPVDGDWPSAECHDSSKVVGSVGSELTRGSEGEGGEDTFLHDGDWVM